MILLFVMDGQVYAPNFNETNWLYNAGQSSDANYEVLFHADGTFDMRDQSDCIYESGIYQYADNVLQLKGISYIWNGYMFVSDEAINDWWLSI